MNRRTMILSGAATLALPALPAFAAPLDYTPGLLKERIEAGDTVFLDFKASWCGTCRAQERVLTSLKQQNPAYDENITFINVDWDTYGTSQMAERMKIPRRSTLVVLKGKEEIGRIVADTSERSIKKLMDAALSAATSA
ncbi:thioredoxin family protein [Planktotalea arctica]|uniref:thioredoxin family protein n=1 Tax=Planktotalea arctica TaxID=1481893 RepID=UPI000A177B7A|nr:thioredoxin family protein [Planktotalea arctica]